MPRTSPSPQPSPNPRIFSTTPYFLGPPSRLSTLELPSDIIHHILSYSPTIGTTRLVKNNLVAKSKKERCVKVVEGSIVVMIDGLVEDIETSASNSRHDQRTVKQQPLNATTCETKEEAEQNIAEHWLPPPLERSKAQNEDTTPGTPISSKDGSSHDGKSAYQTSPLTDTENAPETRWSQEIFAASTQRRMPAIPPSKLKGKPSPKPEGLSLQEAIARKENRTVDEKSESPDRANSSRTARAAYGIYFGKSSPHNRARILDPCLPQTKQLAIILAATEALRTIYEEFVSEDDLSVTLPTNDSNPPTSPSTTISTSTAQPQSPLLINITIQTSSPYLYKCLTDWVHIWSTEGYQNSKGEWVRNHVELKRLAAYCSELENYCVGNAQAAFKRRVERGESLGVEIGWEEEAGLKVWLVENIPVREAGRLCESVLADCEHR